MTELVITKLNGLRDEVRARIEASPDYKAMLAVEKAIADVQGLMTPVAAAAEVVPEAEVAADAPAVAEEIAAASAPAEAATDDVAEAAPEDVDAAAETEAPAETAAAEVIVPDIPAEDQLLVAELAAAAAELPAANANTAP